MVNSYIPNQYVKAVGIVRGIPTDLSKEEIMEYMISPVGVEKVERMNYWNKDEQISKPGTSLKITFRSTQIPNEIKIFYVIKKVEWFVPKPIVCKICLKYGHTANVCKSKNTTLCNNCTAETHAIDEPNCQKSCEHCLKLCLIKCKYCPENENRHRTADFNCPEMKKQTQIKENMIKNKMSYIEAKNLVNNGVGKETFANVTHMMEFNKKLMERIKSTDNLLKEIVHLGNLKGTDDTQNMRLEEIIKTITNHRQSYYIKTNTALEGSSSSK